MKTLEAMEKAAKRDPNGHCSKQLQATWLQVYWSRRLRRFAYVYSDQYEWEYLTRAAARKLFPKKRRK